MDRQRDCTGKGNQAEMHLLFQKTKLYFLFHSQATQISNVSGGEFGKEKLKYTTAFWFFYQELIFNHKLPGESSWLSSALIKGQLPSQAVLGANLCYRVLLPVWAFANLIVAACVCSEIRCTLALPRATSSWIAMGQTEFLPTRTWAAA